MQYQTEDWHLHCIINWITMACTSHPYVNNSSYLSHYWDFFIEVMTMSINVYMQYGNAKYWIIVVL